MVGIAKHETTTEDYVLKPGPGAQQLIASASLAHEGHDSLQAAQAGGPQPHVVRGSLLENSLRVREYSSIEDVY